MGLEFELKYAATQDVLRAIAQQFGEFSRIAMETTYFDTALRALSSKKMTLRCRYENEDTVCTLKTPAAGAARGEFDVHADWSAAAVDGLFAAAGIAPPDFDALSPVCGARFTRLAKTLTLPDCTVELALDEGVLLGGGKEIPLCELEVELKSGSQEAVCRWASLLAQLYGLHQEPHSKFKRALALAEGA